MWIPLEAGASPIVECFGTAGGNTVALNRLMSFGNRDVFDWIEDGLLTIALHVYRSYSNEAQKSLLDWSFSRLKASISIRVAQATWTDDNISKICSHLSDAFRLAVKTSRHWMMKAIFETCQEMGYPLTYSKTDWELDHMILQACGDGDWMAAHRAAVLPAPPWSGEFSADMREAVYADDWRRVNKFFPGLDEYKAFSLAVHSGSDEVAAFLAARSVGQFSAILALLKHCRSGAVSKLLCLRSHLADVLDDIVSTSNYSDLEDWLYHKQLHEYCDEFPCCFLNRDAETLQILLRVISYYAIHKHDIGLLDWLRIRNLATGGLHVCHDGRILSLHAVASQTEKFVIPEDDWDESILLPSLLDVAAQQDNLIMTRYLLSIRSEYKESYALLHAVKAGARFAITELIRHENCTGTTKRKTQYGSAALRVAIRNGDHSLMKILVEATDIHGLEKVGEKEGELSYLDALGEALLQHDHTAVKVIMDNGGDPNAIVAFHGLGKHTPRSAKTSVLSRRTALLLAIDLGDMSLLRLLVDKGASVNQSLDRGLLRTPLQRAAETGDFAMVHYLINQGATVDTVPAYGGGTALQLAAMSGHVGIAALLIEHGAEVNHPPARGPGRTAFEAAAEWCRPDMMYILVQCGAQLDLDISEEIEERYDAEDQDDLDRGIQYRWETFHVSRTQYERAIQFAEERGEHASKKIVQSLWDRLCTENLSPS